MTMKTWPSAGEEVAKRAKVYQQETGVSEYNAVRHVLHEDEVLAERYERGRKSVEELESEVIHDRVIFLMERDDLTYRDAYHQVAKEFSTSGLAEAGNEAAQWLDTTAKIYQQDDPKLSAIEAFDKVRLDNPGLAARAAGYADAPGGGDPRPIAHQQINAMLAGLPKDPGGVRSIDDAVRLVNEFYLEKERDAIGETFAHWARLWVLSNGLPDFESWHLATGLRAVQAEHSAMADTLNGGPATAEGLRDHYSQIPWD